MTLNCILSTGIMKLSIVDSYSYRVKIELLFDSVFAAENPSEYRIAGNFRKG